MIDQVKLSYSFKVVNVERLIKDAIALVDFSRRHTVKCRVDDTVAYIKGDQRRLRQVLQNILSNAVKYSPRGGLIEATAEPYCENQVLMSVSDEGIGIPPEQTGKLFQKYSRVDTPEARAIPGIGLGLWICEAIVRDHGGGIWVESHPGKRSCFKFTLNTIQGDNEAFAAQACGVAKDLGFDPAKTNPNGGALALGYPIGATGAILTVKAIYELHRTGKRYGLITMCIGGGQGIAGIIEKL